MKQLIHQFDHTFTGYVVSLPSWFHSPFLIVTFLGQPIVTIGVGVVIALFAIVQSNQRLLIASIVALSTMGIGTIIKLALERDRPLTDYVANMLVKSYSFPSGHTVGSTVVFGLLAYLAIQAFPQPWGYVAAALLVGLIIAVGLSRVYLGAHFPSDVIAGWVLGLVGLAIIIFIVRPTV